MLSAEVAIVGGGPAGAATAMMLARAGRDVLILERARFPRDKPCGDCANPGSVAELRRLGVADRLRATLGPGELRGWRVEAPDGSVIRADFDDDDDEPLRSWAVRRRDLDAALLDEARRAGARTRFGFRAFDLSRDGRGRVNGVIGREGTRVCRVRAAWTVGADGLRSVVRGRLGLAARRPRLLKIAVVGHTEDEGAAGAAGFGELRVRNGRCCGYAPAAGGANVTLVVPLTEARGIGSDPRAFLLEGLLDFPEVLARVRERGLEARVMVTGPFDVPVRRIWVSGAVLVGDAAGYFDPFTGQGIYQALYGGRLAASALEAALREPREASRALRRYARYVRSRGAATRGLQRVIEGVISRPALMSGCMRVLSRGGGSGARRLLRATGDVAHPLTLLDPLVWLRIALARE